MGVGTPRWNVPCNIVEWIMDVIKIKENTSFYKQVPACKETEWCWYSLQCLSAKKSEVTRQQGCHTCRGIQEYHLSLRGVFENFGFVRNVRRKNRDTGHLRNWEMTGDWILKKLLEHYVRMYLSHKHPKRFQ